MGFTTTEKNQLAELLVEFDVNIVHDKIQEAMADQDEEKVLELCKVKNAVSTILQYMGM